MASSYEKSEAELAPIVKFTVVLVVVSLVVLAAMRLLFDRLTQRDEARDTPRHPLAAERELPPAPRLQVTPALDLEAFRAARARELETYGWIDRDAGTVRVPIERAIDLVLEKGLPVAGKPGSGR
jgi:hypothetical protein